MDAVKRRNAREARASREGKHRGSRDVTGRARRECAYSISGRASPPRSARGCSASRAPKSSRSSTARRRLHARDRSVRRQRQRRPYSLFWAVEGRGRKSVTLDLRTSRRPGPHAPARGHRRRAGREFPAGHARTMEHRPERARSAPRHRAHLDVRPGRPVRAAPGLDRVGIGYGGLLHLTGYPDAHPVRVGVTISDYLTGVFAAQAAVARAVRARRARRQRGGHRRRALRRRRCASSSGRWPRTTGSASCVRARRQPARELGAARQLPHRRRQVRVHRRRLRRQLHPSVQSDGPARPARRSRASPSSRIAAAHGDLINGIVGRMDHDARRARRSRSAASRATFPSLRLTPPPTSSPTRT